MKALLMSDNPWSTTISVSSLVLRRPSDGSHDDGQFGGQIQVLLTYQSGNLDHGTTFRVGDRTHPYPAAVDEQRGGQPGQRDHGERQHPELCRIRADVQRGVPPDPVKGDG